MNREQREQARNARRFADQQSTRFASARGSDRVIAIVTTAVPGGSADGSAYLVKVTWHGTEATAAGYAASYTPAVGHRVVCTFIDSQLIVDYRIVGQP